MYLEDSKMMHSDGQNLLENRKQLTGYSANVMEVVEWKMNQYKKYIDGLYATTLFNKHFVV